MGESLRYGYVCRLSLDCLVVIEQRVGVHAQNSVSQIVGVGVWQVNERNALLYVFLELLFLLWGKHAL